MLFETLSTEENTGLIDAVAVLCKNLTVVSTAVSAVVGCH
jgi:hypothetical protein